LLYLRPFTPDKRASGVFHGEYTLSQKNGSQDCDPHSRYMRTFVRRVEEAIEAGDKDAAKLALREAQPEIMRAAGKGLIHKNASARKVSRLSKRVKALG